MCGRVDADNLQVTADSPEGGWLVMFHLKVCNPGRAIACTDNLIHFADRTLLGSRTHSSIFIGSLS